MLDQVAEDLLAREQGHADLLDLQAAGDISQRRGLVVVGPAGQAEADDRQDHVAGAGDVVDLAGAGRDQEPTGRRRSDQGHAVPVEGDQDRVHPEVDRPAVRPTSIASSGDRISRAGRQARLEAIRASCSGPPRTANNPSSGSGRRRRLTP